ncbi:TetR/AcrR family transcriptional regulator [Pseudonocardia sp. GCM10023141]|uniref:TetR/AcrR family transcriptional regulator n=1 Tax=Pseudonocardia sp. GCM10023141 TaxID=3252653 RepID=UPI00360950ED
MSADVKGNPASGPGGRAARTAAQVIAAATTLFLERGYLATTLTDVAEHAGVAPRTVYVRFGTKADLLKQVIDTAIVGDPLPIDVAHRDGTRIALTAPTLQERIAVHAAGTRAIMERSGPLMAVAAEAAPLEPTIADAATAGRADALHQLRQFWETAHADGLLHPDADLDWILTTSSLIGTVDTYLVLTRTNGWTADTYQEWRYRTWMHLATTPGPPPSAT